MISHRGHAHASTPAARQACRLAGGGDGSQAPKSTSVVKGSKPERTFPTDKGGTVTQSQAAAIMHGTSAASAPKGGTARASVQPLMTNQQLQKKYSSQIAKEKAKNPYLNPASYARGLEAIETRKKAIAEGKVFSVKSKFNTGKPIR